MARRSLSDLPLDVERDGRETTGTRFAGVRARRPARRAHGLGAQRRLARRLPGRARRSRGSAQDREEGRRRSRCGSSTGPTRRERASAAPVRLVARQRARWPTRASCGKLTDRDGISLTEALGAFGSTSAASWTRAGELEGAAAYLELHIEQGLYWSRSDLPLGVVLGTFGVERHRITWRGQAAHAGSTPMDRRRDALAGAAKLALQIREIAAETGGGAVCTSGSVVASRASSRPSSRRQSNSSTSGTSTRSAREDAGEAKSAERRFAGGGDIEVEWERIWSIEPILFDETLVGFCDEAIREVAGNSYRLPSGPLHDAAEVSRAGVPTVMLFVQSLRGLSHTKLEDTRPEHLELAVQALDRLASKTIDWVADGGGVIREPPRPDVTRSPSSQDSRWAAA